MPAARASSRYPYFRPYVEPTIFPGHYQIAREKKPKARDAHEKCSALGHYNECRIEGPYQARLDHPHEGSPTGLFPRSWSPFPKISLGLSRGLLQKFQWTPPVRLVMIILPKSGTMCGERVGDAWQPIPFSQLEGRNTSRVGEQGSKKNECTITVFLVEAAGRICGRCDDCITMY